MQLEGIHHITAITGDAPGNVDFYAGVLGLRLVKKTVNFDAPDVYHLYFGDESGTPGSILTFFEFPGAPRGRHGAGMIHTLRWGVASPAALDFWEERLTSAGVHAVRTSAGVRFEDPEGLGLELAVDPAGEPPLSARGRSVPAGYELTGFAGVRVYGQPADRVLTGALGFQPEAGGGYRLTAGARTATYAYDPPPEAPGRQAAGTVHHIAWASEPEDHAAWRERLTGADLHPTPIIDRQYFRSIYFREPGGVLFEIATIGPGFTVDEAPEHLGEGLMLPPRYEPLRPRLEATLTPLASFRPGGPG